MKRSRFLKRRGGGNVHFLDDYFSLSLSLSLRLRAMEYPCKGVVIVICFAPNQIIHAFSAFMMGGLFRRSI